MAYLQTGLRGLARIRYNDSPAVISRETGFVAPAPIIGQTIVGGNGTRYRTEAMPYGRGFVPVVRDTLTPLVHPFVPGAPTFEVDDSRIIPQPPLPSILPAETRVPIVSPPITGLKDIATKLAFDAAQAKKYGVPIGNWALMSEAHRAEWRQKWPEGYPPPTRSGVSAEAARVDIIAGRDPVRSKIHESGAGDYEGGMEIANPQPTVPLIATKAGITFDDILRIDPVKIQTAEEAAGVVPANGLPAQDYVRWGLMAVAGWILWDMFIKPKKRRSRRRSLRAVRPGRRRAYAHEGRKRRLLQGWQ